MHAATECWTLYVVNCCGTHVLFGREYVCKFDATYENLSYTEIGNLFFLYKTKSFLYILSNKVASQRTLSSIKIRYGF